MPIDKELLLTQSLEAVAHFVSMNRDEILDALEKSGDPEYREIASDLRTVLKVWSISSEDFLRSLDKTTHE
jgi:hypothetical protein